MKKLILLLTLLLFSADLFPQDDLSPIEMIERDKRKMEELARFWKDNSLQNDIFLTTENLIDDDKDCNVIANQAISHEEFQAYITVCVEIYKATINCAENSEGYYRYCDSNLWYELTREFWEDPELDFQVSLNFDVRCEADISYKKRNSKITHYAYNENNESYRLFSYRYDTDTINVQSSFSLNQEIYSVELVSVECEID